MKLNTKKTKYKLPNKIFINNLNIIIKKKINYIGIAFSGGKDSQFLLKIIKKLHKNIILIYINHNTLEYNKQSKQLKNIFKFSKTKKIPLIIKGINIFKTIINKLGFEAAARIFRYKALAKIANKKKINIILLAHHLNDIIETFFLRIFRGTGINGLNIFKKFFKLKKIIFGKPLITYNLNKYFKNFNNKKIIILDKSNYKLNQNRNIVRIIINNIINKFFFSFKIKIYWLIKDILNLLFLIKKKIIYFINKNRYNKIFINFLIPYIYKIYHTNINTRINIS